MASWCDARKGKINITIVKKIASTSVTQLQCKVQRKHRVIIMRALHKRTYVITT